jgi:CheY-like chemotaxis protein
MRKVLIIGGAGANRTVLKIALETAGYRVSSAVTRKYTNRWLGRRIKPFDLIIYDVHDAAQDEAFWLELREQGGATPVLILTPADDATDYAAFGMNRVLRQPYALDDVIRAAGGMFT